MTTRKRQASFGVALAELVADVQTGFASGERDPHGIIQVRMNNLDTQGNLDLADPTRVPTPNESTNTFLLEPGDVLFNNTNSTELVGKSTVFRGYNEPVVFSNHFTRLRLYRDRIDPIYLARWLVFQQRSGVFARLCNRWVNQSAVRKESLLGLQVPLPPLPEQKRIAAILDKADSLRRKRRNSVSFLDDLAMSAFVTAFGSPAHGSTKPLEEFDTEFRYGTSNKSGASGYPALRIPNIIGGAVDLEDLKTVDVELPELNRLRLLDGDLLFVRTNGNPDYVGRSAVFRKSRVANSGYDPVNFIYASYLIRARFDQDKLEPVFLHHYLQTPAGRRSLRERCKTSAGQYNINTEGLGALAIPVVGISQQRTFVRSIQRIEAARQPFNEALAESERLFSSLVQRAFRGDL